MIVHEMQQLLHAIDVGEASNANMGPIWKADIDHSLVDYINILEAQLAKLEKKRDLEGDIFKIGSNEC